MEESDPTSNFVELHSFLSSLDKNIVYPEKRDQFKALVEKYSKQLFFKANNKLSDLREFLGCCVKYAKLYRGSFSSPTKKPDRVCLLDILGKLASNEKSANMFMACSLEIKELLSSICFLCRDAKSATIDENPEDSCLDFDELKLILKTITSMVHLKMLSPHSEFDKSFITTLYAFLFKSYLKNYDITALEFKGFLNFFIQDFSRYVDPQAKSYKLLLQLIRRSLKAILTISFENIYGLGTDSSHKVYKSKILQLANLGLSDHILQSPKTSTIVLRECILIFSEFKELIASRLNSKTPLSNSNRKTFENMITLITHKARVDLSISANELSTVFAPDFEFVRGGMLNFIMSEISTFQQSNAKDDEMGQEIHFPKSNKKKKKVTDQNQQGTFNLSGKLAVVGLPITFEMQVYKKVSFLSAFILIGRFQTWLEAYGSMNSKKKKKQTLDKPIQSPIVSYPKHLNIEDVVIKKPKGKKGRGNTDLSLNKDFLIMSEDEEEFFNAPKGKTKAKGSDAQQEEGKLALKGKSEVFFTDIVYSNEGDEEMPDSYDLGKHLMEFAKGIIMSTYETSLRAKGKIVEVVAEVYRNKLLKKANFHGHNVYYLRKLSKFELLYAETGPRRFQKSHLHPFDRDPSLKLVAVVCLLSHKLDVKVFNKTTKKMLIYFQYTLGSINRIISKCHFLEMPKSCCGPILVLEIGNQDDIYKTETIIYFVKSRDTLKIDEGIMHHPLTMVEQLDNDVIMMASTSSLYTYHIKSKQLFTSPSLLAAFPHVAEWTVLRNKSNIICADVGEGRSVLIKLERKPEKSAEQLVKGVKVIERALFGASKGEEMKTIEFISVNKRNYLRSTFITCHGNFSDRKAVTHVIPSPF